MARRTSLAWMAVSRLSHAAIQTTRASIERGDNHRRVVEEINVFSSTVRQMISAGEATSAYSIHDARSKIADFYEW